MSSNQVNYLHLQLSDIYESQMEVKNELSVGIDALAVKVCLLRRADNTPSTTPYFAPYIQIQ